MLVAVVVVGEEVLGAYGEVESDAETEILMLIFFKF